MEETRPAIVTAADFADEFGLTQEVANDVVRRMARKGWLNRVGQGRYEPLLADSGGIALPNPWAALSTWQVPYYVGYASAAYLRDLVPDRPAVVQVCVKKGTYAPRRYKELPLQLLPQQEFSVEPADVLEVQGHDVKVASAELILLDGGIRPSRAGGIFGLAHIVTRLGRVDWKAFVALASGHRRGRAAARRIAALLTIVDLSVPSTLSRFASSKLPSRPLFLDDREIHGTRGPVIEEFAIRVNVSSEALREEVRR